MSNIKKVIVSGATGQDGSYMCEYLLKNTDCEVLGATRRTSQPILKNLQNCLGNPRFRLVPIELTDAHSVIDLIRKEEPDYFLNFAASSFVADSWNQPAFTMEANANALLHILEAVRKYKPSCRVYSSGSSEQWGDIKYCPQDEKHPMSPRSIYGVSKCAASHICKVYRESYHLYVVHGILTNHESPRRQSHFVSKKITEAVARINKALSTNKIFESCELGNIYAKRDWSHSKDFIDGVWRMINQEQHRPDRTRFNKETPEKYIKDYVLASNETYSVKDLVSFAFNKVGIYGFWQGEGIDEKYIHEHNGINKVLVNINKAFYRPADVELLHGDSSLARIELKWQPKYSFKELINEMVEEDVKNVS